MIEMQWIQDLFGVHKPIIAMCHLHALPGDPDYDAAKGVEWVVEQARKDLHALQDGGVDAVMFSNEYSLPYLLKVEPITHVTMARVIGELMHEITVPYGVNVLWDPIASIELAVATGATFVREIFTGLYASDFGLWNTNCGEVARHRRRIHGEKVRLFFNIVPEAAVYLGDRDIGDCALDRLQHAARRPVRFGADGRRGDLAGHAQDGQEGRARHRGLCQHGRSCPQRGRPAGGRRWRRRRHDLQARRLHLERVDVERVKEFMARQGSTRLKQVEYGQLTMDKRGKQLGDLLVNYATAVEPGERVMIAMGEVESLPLAEAVYAAAIRAGAFPQVQFLSETLRHSLLKYGNAEQLRWVPEIEAYGMEWADVYIGLRGAYNLHMHSDIRRRLSLNQAAMGKVSTLRWEKTRWCLVRVPNAAFAFQAETDEETITGYVLRRLPPGLGDRKARSGARGHRC